MESFNDLIQSDKPVLVDFYADWCGPCKAMDPVVQEVAKALTGRARVIKINIDKNTQAAKAYSVMAVPTYILFRKGNILWRHAGMIDKSGLVKVLEQHT